MEPGQLIVPHGPEDQKSPGGGSPEPERPTEQPVPDPAPTPAPAPAPEPAVLPAPADSAPAATPEPAPSNGQSSSAQPEPADDPAAGWQFREEADATAVTPAQPLPDQLNWTASEFVDHEKGFGWYAMLGLGGIVAAAVIYLLTKDKITTGTILFVLIFFGAVAARKPQTQQYGLSRAGLQIGPKMYSFQSFKTFSVTEEGAIASIVLMPLKRFMPPLTVYVLPEMEEQVVDFLAAYLPFEHRKADLVDSLLHRIRF